MASDASPKPPLAQRIAALGQSRSYPRGTLIFHQGDRSDEIYVVESGQVAVYLSDRHGRDMIINELGPGEFFGEMSLDGNPRSASVVAATDSRLSVVSRHALKQLIHRDPETAFDLLVAVISRIRNATHIADGLVHASAKERLMGRLRRMAVREEGLLVVRPKPKHHHLAERIGVVREMVTKSLTKLGKDGRIAIEKDRIVILVDPGQDPGSGV